MTNLYLFLPRRNVEALDLNSITLSWVYEDENKQLKLVKGLLSDAVVASVGHKVSVVLPGEDVLFLQASVPGKNQQRIQQAVPYILEDGVIDDVDELYFAIAKENNEPSDQKYNVSVINKDYFGQVIQQLKSAGIQADVMMADYFLLSDNNTLFFDGSKIVFNSPSAKFSSSIDNALNLDGIDDVKLINCEKENNSSLKKLIENINIQEESCNSEPLLCLVKNTSSNQVINLLQGPYKKKKDWSQTGKTWFPIAALFLVWLCVQGGLFVADFISLSKQNKNLNIEITKIFKKTFPEARRIIDAKAQMQQKLISLKKRKGQSGRSFNMMLSDSAKALSSAKGLVIKSLRYYDGRINLEINIASLQALDKLKERLTKENGYQVEVQNASSGKETVTARLQIVGAKS